jgi:hypothetical protein
MIYRYFFSVADPDLFVRIRKFGTGSEATKIDIFNSFFRPKKGCGRKSVLKIVMARIRIRTCLILKSRIRTKIVRIRNTDIFFQYRNQKRDFSSSEILVERGPPHLMGIDIRRGEKNFL